MISRLTHKLTKALHTWPARIGVVAAGVTALLIAVTLAWIVTVILVTGALLGTGWLIWQRWRKPPSTYAADYLDGEYVVVKTTRLSLADHRKPAGKDATFYTENLNK